MFQRLFKKSPPSVGGETQRETLRSDENQPSVAPPPAVDSAAQSASWRAKIAAAAFDEGALLQLAREAPSVELKLVALEALTQEESLKQATREFRDRDKRLHRAAKLRWEGVRDQRLAHAEAHAIIAQARTLLEQEQVPANRLVELDHRWRALKNEQLDAALAPQFAQLSAQLSAKAHAQAERARAVHVWLTTLDAHMEQLSVALPAVAQGDAEPTALEALSAQLLQLLGNVPAAEDVRCLERIEQAQRQRALVESVVQRANWLRSLPLVGTAQAADAQGVASAAIEAWRALPAPEPGSPAQRILAQRFDAWSNAMGDARKREAAARGADKRAQREQQDQQRVDSLLRQIEAAETAHAEGRVAELADRLADIDQALKGVRPDAALSQRIELLRGEHARLQDWKRWSGGVSREQLAAEAQALAGLAAGKINLKAHADTIQKLRDRWKELDRLGAASNHTLWLSFDGALKSAYEPVAAQQEKLKQARAENLASREQIIAQLAQASAQHFPPAQEDAAAAPAAQPDWRAVAQALDQARVAWQKLGPVEHTVPRAALQGDASLTARHAAAVQALEAPLSQAYDSARKQREKLIRAATELGTGDVSARDVIDKVRNLQTQWQAAARALPLRRNDENALWAAFKSATDAIFNARDAARAAQQAESNAHLKAREEIIERLAAAAASSSPAEIRRTMAEADSAWRAGADGDRDSARAGAGGDVRRGGAGAAGPRRGGGNADRRREGGNSDSRRDRGTAERREGAGAGRPEQTKLDARYDAARETAAKKLVELALSASQARFDALIAAEALCHEREAAGAQTTPEWETRWAAIADLPHAWKAALETRLAGASATTESTDAAPPVLLDALLNLESLCGIDSPSAFLAERQTLKMRALKLAMETRQDLLNQPAEIERWLLRALACAHPDHQSRERVLKIIAALRGAEANGRH